MSLHNLYDKLERGDLAGSGSALKIPVSGGFKHLFRWGADTPTGTPDAFFYVQTDAATLQALLWFDVAGEWVASGTRPSRNITADASVLATDGLLLAAATSAAITVTLLGAASFAGQSLAVKKTDSSANTVTLQGAENIDGDPTLVISGQNDSATVYSDGTEYWIADP